MFFDFITDTISPDASTVLTIGGTGSLVLPVGTTAQRPTPAAGYIRYNSDNNAVEFYNSTAAAWQTSGNTETSGLAALSTTGIVTRTGAGTYTTRTLTGTGSRLSVSNGTGVAGNPTFDIDATYVGQTSITTLGTIGTGTWSATTIAANRGGTGQTTYVIGDILSADTTSTLSRIADVATGNALISGGTNTLPSWGKIGLTTHVSGTLAIGSGGTNITTYTTGDILYASAANVLSKLAIGTTNQVLTVIGGIPSWQAASGSGARLDQITAATGANSINNGDNAQTWNWALTTAAKSAFKFTENTAATGGAGSQFLVDIDTIAASTAAPLRVQAKANTALTIDPNSNVVLNSAAIAVGATDGFLYYAGCAGKPTGTPTVFSGREPMVFDTSNWVAYSQCNTNASAANAWRPVAVQKSRFVTHIEDDFRSGVSPTTSATTGEMNWTESASGTAANSIQASTADHHGVIRLGTGTTSGNNTRLHLTNGVTNSGVMANQVQEFIWIVSVPTITSIVVKMGLCQDASDVTAGATPTYGTNGVFFVFDPIAVSANWLCYTRSGNTTGTALDTTVAVTAGNWYVLRAVRNGTTNWQFYVNDVSRGTITTNLPTTAVNMGAIVVTATTATRQLDIDYFYMVSEVLGNRYT